MQDFTLVAKAKFNRSKTLGQSWGRGGDNPSTPTNGFHVDVLSPNPTTLAFVPHPASPRIPTSSIVPTQPPTDPSKNSLDPNRNLHGHVSFERDSGARQMNVVLPISGAVFEFSYARQP